MLRGQVACGFCSVLTILPKSREAGATLRAICPKCSMAKGKPAMTAKMIDKPFDGSVAQWHLICCLTRMEAAMEALDRAAFPIYCPRIEVMKPPPLRTIKPSQRKFAYMLATPVRVPLFPGYFLAGLYQGQDHHGIFKIWNIDGLRCEDGRPVAINERFLTRMRECETAGAIRTRRHRRRAGGDGGRRP